MYIIQIKRGKKQRMGVKKSTVPMEIIFYELETYCTNMLKYISILFLFYIKEWIHYLKFKYIFYAPRYSEQVG